MSKVGQPNSMYCISTQVLYSIVLEHCDGILACIHLGRGQVSCAIYLRERGSLLSQSKDRLFSG
jgi:hypothetical protein